MTSIFPLEIPFDGKMHSFTVKPVTGNNNLKYEVWKDGNLYFKLESSDDSECKTLKISPQFNSAGIDPVLAEKVATAVRQEEDYETYD